MSTTENQQIIEAIERELDEALLSLDDLVDGELDWLVEAAKSIGVRQAVESFLEDGAEELAAIVEGNGKSR